MKFLLFEYNITGICIYNSTQVLRTELHILSVVLTVYIYIVLGSQHCTLLSVVLHFTTTGTYCNVDYIIIKIYYLKNTDTDVSRLHIDAVLYIPM